jgi:hypothetical protein
MTYAALAPKVSAKANSALRGALSTLCRLEILANCQRGRRADRGYFLTEFGARVALCSKT